MGRSLLLDLTYLDGPRVITCHVEHPTASPESLLRSQHAPNLTTRGSIERFPPSDSWVTSVALKLLKTPRSHTVPFTLFVFSALFIFPEALSALSALSPHFEHSNATRYGSSSSIALSL